MAYQPYGRKPDVAARGRRDEEEEEEGEGEAEEQQPKKNPYKSGTADYNRWYRKNVRQKDSQPPRLPGYPLKPNSREEEEEEEEPERQGGHDPEYGNVDLPDSATVTITMGELRKIVETAIGSA